MINGVTNKKELDDAWFQQVKQVLRKNGEHWFVSFSFPFNIVRPVAEKQIKEWLRRLKQALHLKEHKIFYEFILAQQIREVLHIHMIITAKGLSGLDERNWEKKWAEITGQKKEDKYFKIRARRRPAVIRRRKIENGIEEAVVGHIRVPKKELVNTSTSYTGGGTCEIHPVGYGEEYAPAEVAGYIVSRHNREVLEDMQFGGNSKFAVHEDS